MARREDVALAVRFEVLRLEKVAQEAVLKAKDSERLALVEHIMRELQRSRKSIEDQGALVVYVPTVADGKGPPCPIGFQQEFGVCVPID